MTELAERYRKLDGEGDYEYGLRLIEMKVEQKPDDLDWQDIIEATGIDCHRDTLRKAASTTPYSGYAVAQYFKEKQDVAIHGEEPGYQDELDRKLVDLRKESKKFYDQRREFNKLVDKMGREEHLEDQLIKAALALNDAQPLEIGKPDDMFFAGDNEAVLVFADWHYGMTADNIWQQYNVEICRERVCEVLRKAIARISLHRCRRLHIVLLGDMAHGAIHTTARVASEELVCEQVMHVSELIAQAINALADTVEETVVHATWGNHLRTMQNKKESIHADNMERLIPWWLKQRLSGREDVVFPEAEYYEFLYFDVCGYQICATHGDLDGVRSAGETLGALFRKKYGGDLDYVILADKHHREVFESMGVRSMIVPCLCGTDEYANGKRLYSTPGQLLMIFNPQEGCDCEYVLKTGE